MSNPNWFRTCEAPVILHIPYIGERVGLRLIDVVFQELLDLEQRQEILLKPERLVRPGTWKRQDVVIRERPELELLDRPVTAIQTPIFQTLAQCGEFVGRQLSVGEGAVNAFSEGASFGGDAGVFFLASVSVSGGASSGSPIPLAVSVSAATQVWTSVTGC